MNYLNHYNKLIERARNRVLDFYPESHHIIPKCMGGNDIKDNLIDLTPEEHFVAHQLLVKIYPYNHGLVKAANMMCAGSRKNKRGNNKLYGWLRRRLSTANSNDQKGEKNSQFGKVWIYNYQLHISKKINKFELENYIKNGWNKGRIVNFNKLHSCCVCNKILPAIDVDKTCGPECLKIHTSNISTFPLKGRENEFLKRYKESGSMNGVLKAMGCPGAVSHYYKWAKNILDKQLALV